MPSVSKTQYGTYRVLWYSGRSKKQKTFPTKKEAKKFAAALELSPEEKSSHISLGDLLIEYRDKVTRKKKGQRAETYRINRILKAPIAQKMISDITVKDINDYIEVRLRSPSRKFKGLISRGTVLKEFVALSSVFNKAIKDGLLEKNPCKYADRPKPTEPRERVASDEDIEKLTICSGWDGTSVPETLVQLTMAAFLFACKTGMRSGEILNLDEAWIDGNVIHLPKEVTKTNTKRDVALSKEALRILDLVRERGCHPFIFGDLSAATKDVLWRRIRDRAGLGPVVDSRGIVIREGLNFHDSRATFATWAASPDPATGAPRLEVLALARQTGHKDLKMLLRYYRPTAQDIAKQLDAHS